jgi:hypothetical protein
MDRRTLLRSAMVIPLGVLTRPRSAWAAAPATPTGAVQAVEFTGLEYYKNDGGWSLLPVSSPKFFGSFIYSTTQQYAGNTLNKDILVVQDDSNQQALVIRLTTNKKNGWRLQFWAAGSANNWVQAWTPIGSLPGNGSYQRIKVQLDASARLLRASLNDTPLTWNPINWSGTAFDVPYITSPFNGGALRWYVGGSPFIAPRYVGNLAEVQVALDQTVDITNINVKNAFTDPTTGLPVHHAADGQVPVVDANGVVVQTISHALYMSGGELPFPRNFPGWTPMSFNDFLNGTPGATFHSMTEATPPSSFYAATGVFPKTARKDPWGNIGES